jgi:hypothetical protein
MKAIRLLRLDALKAGIQSNVVNLREKSVDRDRKKSHVWEFPLQPAGRNTTRRNFRQQRWEEIRRVGIFANSVGKKSCNRLWILQGWSLASNTAQSGDCAERELTLRLQDYKTISIISNN